MLDDLWVELDVIEVDQPLVGAAAAAARSQALRGHDAVHCVSAVQLMAPDLVAASGDRKLLDAWHAGGIATYDVNDAQ